MPKDTPEQPRLISDPGSEYKITPEEQTRKEEYRQRLREYLSDPEFRKIPGFPIGDDEAILKLSNPPCYTACPNPFLPEIIEEWQKERDEIRNELGLPDESVNRDSYHREPFAADVSEGKNNPIYNVHSYHTKVPHPAIMRYILHYTDPGDIVFDGFCGTGMTGVAAQLCGDRVEVEKLGFYINEDGKVYETLGSEKVISKLGSRKAILNDLSPVATFISHNYNTTVDMHVFEEEANKVLNEINDEYGWIYETLHTDGKTKCRLNYVVWSDVFICSNCSEEIVFWDAVIDPVTKQRKKENKRKIICSSCKASQTINSLVRAQVVVNDVGLQKPHSFVKQVPVLINYQLGKQKLEKKPDKFDLELVEKINSSRELIQNNWFPIYEMPYGLRRLKDAYHLRGIQNVHHFYSNRSLIAYSAMWAKASNAPDEIRTALQFWLQSVGIGFTKMNRFFESSYSQVNRYLKGTLYVAPIIAEVSPWYSLLGKIRQHKKLSILKSGSSCLFTASSTSINLSSDSVDYIFVDPPFGRNLMYGELNFIWESWLKVFTKREDEAIIDETQSKLTNYYHQMMYKSFSELYRILKPGHWMTVEFHNSQSGIWNVIQESIIRAGFMIADIRVLDKKQITMQQWVGTNVVDKDLVISAYKLLPEIEQKFALYSGTADGVWTFIRQHLAQLPVVVQTNQKLEIISERQAYLLFDRMVAFHIQRGASVPLSAAQFYAGLEERFPSRDDMYFLPEQVPEYDRARLEVDSIAQLTFVVSDEKSAIQWLRQSLSPQLGGEPQTHPEIQPKFLKQLHQAKHEMLPELSVLLEQNFLQDEQKRWYVPDPNRAEDLEKIRGKSLLKEFYMYLEEKKQLKQFRTEAIRAGFANAWQRKDYKTIVKVGNRLPEGILREDPDLLMYYDNASLRVD